MKASDWRLSGSVSLWRYTENQRNYPGWHLTADADSCKSLEALFRLLVSSGNVNSAYTLKIDAPTFGILSIPNNKRGQAKWIAPQSWTVQLSEEESMWSFSETDRVARLVIGVSWLQPLLDGVTAIAGGQGDYSIGGNTSEDRLWFWWQPKMGKHGTAVLS